MLPHITSDVPAPNSFAKNPAVIAPIGVEPKKNREYTLITLPL